MDPACRAAEEAGDVSWQHAAHNVTGALEGFTAPAAMLLIALGVWGFADAAGCRTNGRESGSSW